MRKTYRRRRRPTQNRQLQYPINEGIKSEMVMLIDDEGENLGALSRDKALALAHERELDLVLVGPKAIPPVAKLIDQGKFRYEQEKQLQKQKAKQKRIEVKGIRLSFKIGKHDKELKKKQALKFIEQGHKVKLEMLLRGRERQYRDLAKENITTFIQDLGEGISTEQDISMQGAKLTVLISKENK